MLTFMFMGVGRLTTDINNGHIFSISSSLVFLGSVVIQLACGSECKFKLDFVFD